MEFAVLLGPPGSGKGTIAAAVISKSDFEHVSTGARIREEMQNPESAIGNEARPFMDRSEFVPDQLALNLVDKILGEGSDDRKLLFDGFPRTASQGRAFDRLVRNRGDRFTGAFLLEAPNGELVRRLAGRRCCEACGTVFNLYWNCPMSEEICDVCGGALRQRLDDLKANVEKRIGLHKTQTLGLVDYYRKEGVLHEIDACSPPEQSAQRIIEILNA